jgi:diguanylate cyclase (GGDEF)-like protein
MNILVVEDDRISRALLQKTLEEWGYTVIPAENGQEALDLFNEGNVKFIIADWLMPVMDGLTLCRKIRSSSESGYVFFMLLTGRDKKADIIEGLEAGADDYIAKPFDRDELRVRVRAGVRILTLEKELNEKNEKLRKFNVVLEEIAKVDALTDIGNRRSFYESIDKAHHRAGRYSQKYGLIMCDIDHFKSYNDTYGHLEGDRILKIIATTIRNSIRISDEVFRYGGEEFVVILQGQEINGAIDFAERIRKAVESLQLEHKGCSTGILTVSCGIAVFKEADKDKQWDVILNEADKALYSAKSSGRNRVSVFDED